MQTTIKIFGHFPPDTDTVCSPIAYAWYLRTVKGENAEAFRTGELNKETSFVLEKFGIEEPKLLETVAEDDQIIIMDTNNPEELISGIDNAKILEIIDHHKMTGGISTPEPINATFRTAGCTATIVYQLISGITEIPKDIAGILLACILSDTLNFSSPTTTEEDKAAAEALAEIANVNADDLAKKMFEAKSDLTGYAADELLKLDSKVFDFNSKKVRISVLETTDPSQALSMKPALLEGMNSLRSDESLDTVFFFIVDILKNEATLILAGPEEERMALKAFPEKVTDGMMILPGVVSRKKQIAPAIEEAYQ